jgi:hypothetical protein
VIGRWIFIFTAAALGLYLAAATPAHAATAAPDFMCPDRTICFFHNTDYTGTVEEFPATDPAWRNKWININSCCRGSMNNNTASDVEVWNAQTNDHACILPQIRTPLNNSFGYFYLHYGVSNGCQGIPGGP